MVYIGYLRKNLEVDTFAVFTWLKLSLECCRFIQGIYLWYGTGVWIFWWV